MRELAAPPPAGACCGLGGPGPTAAGPVGNRRACRAGASGMCAGNGSGPLFGAYSRRWFEYPTHSGFVIFCMVYLQLLFIVSLGNTVLFCNKPFSDNHLGRIKTWF